LLAHADIVINGPNPWDIQVHDKRWYSRVLRDKNLGLGESYMAGWWDCRQVDEMICRLLRGGLEKIPKHPRDLEYYLLSCAGAFRARYIQLWQTVMTPYGVGRTQPNCRGWPGVAAPRKSSAA